MKTSMTDKVDIDFTWEKISEAQGAAFDIAMKQRPTGITEFQAAEFILTAGSSLWYIQAKRWAESPPEIGKAKPVWQHACQFIVKTVDTGWDGKTWWNLTGYKPQEIATEMLFLMDFGQMVDQYRNQSMSIVSQGFDIFIQIVCGNNWRAKYKKLIAKMEKVTK